MGMIISSPQRKGKSVGTSPRQELWHAVNQAKFTLEEGLATDDRILFTEDGDHVLSTKLGVTLVHDNCKPDDQEYMMNSNAHIKACPFCNHQYPEKIVNMRRFLDKLK